ncbi:hypothetical protein [Mucilaginibacter myungsuensis]|uniref:Uncharacterized protein n=1 Tax=Mucilaginibacter myungsuensis TaxID=649104 RepID=A0A929KYS7_9SPHI|nr:hypothetical protein [Mucilaginibacter myungsuensis]MBE9661080.1 hypothetical protein [Mucilaginibacter myungsuensis]MDN3597224.1 hypothetical protein [Mucilaginibacter myungsuensis]
MTDYLSIILEGLALLVGLISFNKITIGRYKLLPPYLAIIISFEICNMMGLFAYQRTNLWVMNIAITFEFLFFGAFILSAYRNKKEQRIFGLIMLAVLLYTVIDVVWVKGVFKLGYHAIVVQYSLLIVIVCRLFYNMMQEFDRGTSLAHDPDFWVSTGLLFFFLAEFLFFASFKLAYTHPDTFSALFKVIKTIANFILYSCLIVSFLWARRAKKISY